MANNSHIIYNYAFLFDDHFLAWWTTSLPLLTRSTWPPWRALPTPAMSPSADSSSATQLACKNQQQQQKINAQPSEVSKNWARQKAQIGVQRKSFCKLFFLFSSFISDSAIILRLKKTQRRNRLTTTMTDDNDEAFLNYYVTNDGLRWFITQLFKKRNFFCFAGFCFRLKMTLFSSTISSFLYI